MANSGVDPVHAAQVVVRKGEKAMGIGRQIDASDLGALTGNDV